MTRLRGLLPSTDNGRAILLGLVGLAVGFALSPWPWLGVIVPSLIVLLLGLFVPTSSSPEEPDR